MLRVVTQILLMESYKYLGFPSDPGGWNDLEELVKRKIRDLLQFLMFSSIFVGIACASMVYIASLIQGVECNPVSMVMMFLVCFSVYNLNRKTDEAEDAINREDRYSFTKKYETHLYLTAIAGSCLALLLASLYGFSTFLLIMTPFIAGILYSIPFLPPKTGFRRLKEIPLVKNIVVTIAWAVPLTYLPLSVDHAPVTPATGITLLFFLSWAFIASTLPDIRDKEGDEQAGIRTIPVVIGVDRTLILLTGINVFLGIGVVILSIMYLQPVITLLITLSVMYTQLVIRSFSHTHKKGITFDILNDGQFFIIGLIAYSTGILISSLVYISL
jgi:4-hydroxybenzoate polyprenyltransferase